MGHETGDTGQSDEGDLLEARKEESELDLTGRMHALAGPCHLPPSSTRRA